MIGLVSATLKILRARRMPPDVEMRARSRGHNSAVAGNYRRHGSVLGVVLGLACASVPFAALAQSYFPSLFNPFGAQRLAPAQAGARPTARFGAHRARAARSFAATGAPYVVQPRMTYGMQPQVTFGVQPQVTFGVQPQVTYGVQPQVPYVMRPEASTFAAPRRTARPRFSATSARADALAYARDHRVEEMPPQAPRAEGQAWCVRSCDGRYFPVSGADDKERGDTCKNLCPASEMAIVRGNTIDNAVTESGKSYSELPNAFRYRNELVAGCTCNGKDRTGLARVEIDNDQTLRKGDIVAAVGGLEVARRDADVPGGAKLSPLSRSARALLGHLPSVTTEQ